MPRALSEDMRWKIVYQRIAEGEPWSRIAGPFVSKTTAKDIVRLFLETRGVTSRQGERAAPPANQVMTEEVAPDPVVDPGGETKQKRGEPSP